MIALSKCTSSCWFARLDGWISSIERSVFWKLYPDDYSATCIVLYKCWRGFVRLRAEFSMKTERTSIVSVQWVVLLRKKKKKKRVPNCSAFRRRCDLIILMKHSAYTRDVRKHRSAQEPSYSLTISLIECSKIIRYHTVPGNSDNLSRLSFTSLLVADGCEIYWCDTNPRTMILSLKEDKGILVSEKTGLVLASLPWVIIISFPLWNLSSSAYDFQCMASWEVPQKGRNGCEKQARLDQNQTDYIGICQIHQEHRKPKHQIDSHLSRRKSGHLPRGTLVMAHDMAHVASQ